VTNFLSGFTLRKHKIFQTIEAKKL